MQSFRCIWYLSFPVHTQLLTYWLRAINLRDTVAAAVATAVDVARKKQTAGWNSVTAIDDSLFESLL